MKTYCYILLFAVSAVCLAGCSCSGGENGVPEPRVEKPETAHRIANINFKKEFNDLNEEHLSAATTVGVNAQNVDSIEGSEIIGRLVAIESNEAYIVDKLTHSVPYLVPEAADLLEEIGRSFQDSLVMHHLPPYKVIVTSVLRTGKHIKKLSHRNVNAAKNSAHCYATTFDITYKRFQPLTDAEEVPQIKLKLVLGEVLRDLKMQKRCYVKHEVKQACFHITTR